MDKAASGLAIRITSLLALKFALILATLWGFIWGVAVLALRTTTDTHPKLLLWGLAGLIPATAAAIVAAIRRMPHRSALRALLDQRNRCGGLLMASDQAELGEWRDRIPEITPLHLRWHGRRPVVLLTASAAFVTISFFAPVRFGAMASDRPLDVNKETAELGKDIETLRDEQIIEQSNSASLEQKLDQIEAEASGEDPVKTWEALDHLQDEVSKTAEQAAEKMAQQAQQLAQAEALAEALKDGASELDPKLMTEAMKELSSLMDSAGGESDLFKDALSDETLDGLKSGSLDSKQLKELAASLGKHKGELLKRLDKLREAELIDLKTFKKCEAGGKCSSAGLAEFLKENADEMSVSEMMEAWTELPGKGGIDRGRADAPMTWSDGTSEQGVKFKEQVIPPSAIAGLKDSQLVGRSTGAPAIEKNGPSQRGALKNSSAGGGSAFTHTVLPRHKGAVKRYFERP